MKRRHSRYIEVTLILIGFICLVIIFSRDDVPEELLEHVQINTRQSPFQKQPLKQTNTISSQFTWPRCQINDSAVNVSGFTTLPSHIQDFLLYRHCRHFPMLLDVPNKCGGAQKSSEVFLLLVIKSSPWNYDRREVLRKTWANERLLNGPWVRRIFILGTTSTGLEKTKLNKLLALENLEHNDILQWDFNDSFYNLTLKQVLFLEWMDRNCPWAQFLLNGDDDIFANTDNIVEYLRSLNNDGNKHLFVGHLIQYVGPIRERGSKYYVPVQVQRSDSYPPYLGGGGFVLSGYTAKVIFNMSQSIELLPIDDVYIGMCLKRAGLGPVSHIGVKTAGLQIPSQNADPHDPCYYKDILLVHRFLPYQIYIMWHGVHDPNLRCD